MHNTAETALSSPAYGREDTAYREYLVKLRHIPEKMFTDAGRVLAHERLKFMEEFFARLNLEVYDN